MTGSDKRTPLMIWQFKKPRCFKNLNVDEYLQYRNSSKAWMNMEIFNEWLYNWNKTLKQKQKKILLVVDHCPSHRITIELSMIEVLYLPKNTTTVLQPMDQGIIRSFKSHFNKFKFKHIIEQINYGDATIECYKKLTLKDAVLFSYLAWKDVSVDTISKCFQHAKWENRIEEPIMGTIK
ncbi:tigger transposable element-derived protein 6-like [Octopus sinensis]|uniref:Tigger transposable element-derived protein 6-like n=1 Tax=Octopus sinensis TaxID=2607531 RepID=A0A6P7U6H3_9MOLL|nr:tigger transposable element-derived protein 6-like [Octopus sinensis]